MIFTTYNNYNLKGFTLIELLIVIGIIAIISASVVVSINPGKQFAVVRDTSRERHLNSLNKAFLSYQINNHGNFKDINFKSNTLTEICNTNTVNPEDCGELVDASALVKGGYIASLPVDPDLSENSIGTGYEVALPSGSLVLKAKNSETKTITTAPDNVLAIGGNVATFYDPATEKEYQIHAFTNLGDDTFNFFGSDQVEVDVLIVAGGAGGGGRHGAGGGAGGIIYRENYFITGGENINVHVGAGGEGGAGSGGAGKVGLDSTFDGLVAIGGGAGSGADKTASQDGGSGGGMNSYQSPHEPGLGLQPTSEYGGFGNSGGGTTYGTGSPYNHAGGGGAGEVGGDGTEGTPGAGGDGLYYGDIFGEKYGEDGWFAGGGAGGSHSPTPELSGFNNQGGRGGGGNGGQEPYDSDTDSGGVGDDGEDGLINTGAGGGGGSTNSGNGGGGGNGGSGVVLVRYEI